MWIDVVHVCVDGRCVTTSVDVVLVRVDGRCVTTLVDVVLVLSLIHILTLPTILRV